MLCQRCGLCCYTMGVAIMYEVRDRGLMGVWKRDYEACPHLSFDGVTARCAVHDRPEYKGSPCWTYGNPDVDPDFASKRGRPCMVGEAVLEQGGLYKIHPKARQVAMELQILGPWPEPEE
jgi:hypothetical protein